MKIYIAAPFALRGQAAEIAQHLGALGHRVTSRWITDDSETIGDEWARKDLADVAEANLLLAFNPMEWKNIGTGGRHVELGYALALGKQVVIFGVRSNIFHHLSDVRVIGRLEDL